MSNKRPLRGRTIPAVASLEKSLTTVGRTTPRLEDSQLNTDRQFHADRVLQI